MVQVEARPIRTFFLDDYDRLEELIAELGVKNFTQETVWVVTLDTGKGIRSVAMVALGDYSRALVPISAILTPVVHDAVEEFIVIHNHPGQDIGHPSPQDMAFTLQIKAAAAVLGLKLLDHIIVDNAGAWFSYADAGMLDQIDERFDKTSKRYRARLRKVLGELAGTSDQ